MDDLVRAKKIHIISDGFGADYVPAAAYAALEARVKAVEGGMLHDHLVAQQQYIAALEADCRTLIQRSVVAVQKWQEEQKVNHNFSVDGWKLEEDLQAWLAQHPAPGGTREEG